MSSLPVHLSSSLAPELMPSSTACLAPGLHAHLVEHLASSTPLIPLENHIRVGPLLPRTSQSVRMRFMALEAGVHEIETLTVSGVGEGFAINLK